MTVRCAKTPLGVSLAKNRCGLWSVRVRAETTKDLTLKKVILKPKGVSVGKSGIMWDEIARYIRSLYIRSFFSRGLLL